jgi:rhamnosyl/mannosyltransferase
MDILIVASEAPPITSGLARCVERLGTGLTGRGHHVGVLSSVQMPRLALHEFRLSSLAMHWRWLARGLQDYDVVNLHGPAPTLSDSFLYLLSRLPLDQRPPLVYTHHGALAISGLGPLCGLYNAAHRMLSRHSTLIVASSTDYADYHFLPGGPPVTVVPWGADPPPSRQGDGVGPSPLGLDLGGDPSVTAISRPDDPSVTGGRPLRVLFVGQMRPYKGVETLLRAVAGRPELALTLVGSGPKRRYYERLASRLGAGNVTFRGWVSDQALAEEYRRQEVVVLPSITQAEAYGLVLLEGMRAGCVPVASDLPGVRGVAGPTGRLVTPGDTGSLRDTLLALSRDREGLRALRQRSILRAGQLDWDSTVAAYDRAFRAAIERHQTLRRGVGEVGTGDRQTGRTEVTRPGRPAAGDHRVVGDRLTIGDRVVGDRLTIGDRVVGDRLTIGDRQGDPDRRLQEDRS